MKGGGQQSVHGLKCTQVTECSMSNLPFGGLGLPQPMWWDAKFRCFQFMGHQSLGYREIVSLQTLV